MNVHVELTALTDETSEAARQTESIELSVSDLDAVAGGSMVTVLQ